MSADAKAALLALKGAMFDMTPEDQQAVAAAKQELAAVVEKHGERGQFALALLSVEQASEA